MHTMVQMLNLTRKEFERNLVGLTDEDARKRIEPMNCISWIIAHVACQHRAFFVDWPAGRKTDSRYLPYGHGAPPSEPPLDEAMGLWQDACKESEAWLQAATPAKTLWPVGRIGALSWYVAFFIPGVILGKSVLSGKYSGTNRRSLWICISGHMTVREESNLRRGGHA